MVLKLNLQTLIDDLKVLVDLGCENVQFKLSQDAANKKYFDVIAISPDKNITRTTITIDSFEKSGPEELPQQEVEFLLDPTATSFIFGKFHQRFNIIGDEVVDIQFNATRAGEHEPS